MFCAFLQIKNGNITGQVGHILQHIIIFNPVRFDLCSDDDIYFFS